MSFWQQYADSLAIVLTLILGGIALRREAHKNNEERILELHNSANKLREDSRIQRELMKKEILDTLEDNKILVEHEKKVVDMQQESRCDLQAAQIRHVEHQLNALREERRLNLKCQDVILEVLSPQGNGRVQAMRNELKDHLLDNATRPRDD